MNILSGMRTFVVSILASLILLGCHSYGRVKNQPTDQLITDRIYSLKAQTQAEVESGRSPEIKFVLTFSGGGTRAAAVAPNWSPGNVSGSRNLYRVYAELTALYDGVKTFSDKETRKYIHFVDGGITDNMGLRAMSDVIEFGGGLKTYLQKKGEAPPETIVLISVNASTSPQTEMDATTKQPSIAKSIGAMSSVQLHRYNVATVELVKSELESWAKELSTPDHQVTAYFIEVSFENIEQLQLKLFLNKVPTSFKLTDEQVDKLTDSARELLKADFVFQKLLSDFGQP